MFKAFLFLLLLQIPGAERFVERETSSFQRFAADSVPEVEAYGSRRSLFRSVFRSRSRRPFASGRGLFAELGFLLVLALIFKLLGFGKGSSSASLR